MNKSELQIFIGKTIVESKMSVPAKRQLLKFIHHEADIHQLMCLIMDGKITMIDEQAKQIVEDRFNMSYAQKIIPTLKTTIDNIKKK